MSGRADRGQPKGLREELSELVDVVGPGPLVDLLLERATELKATDIHFDPSEDGLRVRLRVDGLLHEVVRFPATMASQVVSRIKVQSGLDVTGRHSVQDGHLSISLGNQSRDVRVATAPTLQGERLVLRLMPVFEELTRLDELGLDAEQIDELTRFIRAPYGMVLATGPVGSGKSTTMYAGLELRNQPTESAVTIEDPVERRLEGANQIQVDSRTGIGFVEALRGVLRQDPDVIMIGEIRDGETAHIGCQAALTGTTILSTMHASDPTAAIGIFREFGIPPLIIAESLRGIVAQRLVRRICPHCRTSDRPDPGKCEILGIDADRAEEIELSRGTGCERCFHTGYSGRVALFEVMPVDGPVHQAILERKAQAELLEVAQANGMKTLEEVAREAVLAGLTSLEEAQRVLISFPR